MPFIIDIQFEPSKNRLWNKYTGAKAVAGSADYIRAANEVTEIVGKNVAFYLRNRFFDVLKPKGSMDVGASGKAAHNIEIKFHAIDAKGRKAWQLIEGELTPANELMRKGVHGRGVNPQRGWVGSTGTSIKINPVQRKLAQWANQRRIPLYDPHPDSSKQSREPVKYIKSRITTSRRDRPLRPYKKDMPKFFKAIQAIYWAIVMYGTQRKEANWWKKRPQGSGRFDYVAHVVDSSREQILNVAADKATLGTIMFLDRIISGRKFHGQTSTLGSTTREGGILF